MTAMQADQHIWRTADGDLVPHGHPDAAVLAYAAGDPIPDDVARTLGIKAKAKPQDKAVTAREDKGGLRVDTVETLRRQLDDLGVTYHKNWGAPRLRRALDEAAVAAPDDGGDEPGDAGDPEGDEEE